MTLHNITPVSASTATLISPAAVHSDIDITIQNLSGSATIYIGGAGVTTSDYGYALAGDQAISFVLRGKDELYAISDAAPTGSNVAVIILGVM